MNHVRCTLTVTKCYHYTRYENVKMSKLKSKDHNYVSFLFLFFCLGIWMWATVFRFCLLFRYIVAAAVMLHRGWCVQILLFTLKSCKHNCTQWSHGSIWFWSHSWIGAACTLMSLSLKFPRGKRKGFWGVGEVNSKWVSHHVGLLIYI